MLQSGHLTNQDTSSVSIDSQTHIINHDNYINPIQTKGTRLHVVNSDRTHVHVHVSSNTYMYMYMVLMRANQPETAVHRSLGLLCAHLFPCSLQTLPSPSIPQTTFTFTVYISTIKQRNYMHKKPIECNVKLILVCGLQWSSIEPLFIMNNSLA